MKRGLSIIFILVLVASISFIFAEIDCKPNQMVGDVDGDGSITKKDAEIISSIDAGVISAPKEICCADIDKDGLVNVFDSLYISEIVEGKRTNPLRMCGLVAYYNMNDFSVDNLNGNCSGESCPASSAGVIGSAYNFDGNDYINLGNTTDFNFHWKKITFSAWIKPESTTGWIFDKGVQGNNGWGLRLLMVDYILDFTEDIQLTPVQMQLK